MTALACQEQEEHITIFDLESLKVDLIEFYNSESTKNMSAVEMHQEVEAIFHRNGGEFRDPTEQEFRYFNSIPRTESSCVTPGSTIVDSEMVDHGDGTWGFVTRWSDGSITWYVGSNGSYESYCFGPND
ncbi:hypothetical protein [Ekhidna sp.]|uniref:hypothetical protein n=1 Tax=Ekhidna sp. TaxID=2608089 RepID=UPI0032977916